MRTPCVSLEWQNGLNLTILNEAIDAKLLDELPIDVSDYPAGAAGVGIKGGVGGGSVSCTSSPIGSHMAGPITLKLSGIDRGNSVTVLGRVRGGMNQDS